MNYSSNEINNLSNAINSISTTFSETINSLSDNFSNDLNHVSGNVQDISKVLDSISLKVNILIHYESKTKTWLNETVIPMGSTAFDAILNTADVKYVDYGGELGLLVNSINGLESDSTHGWIYWYWDKDNSEWLLPEYSSTKYILHRDDNIAWTYSDYGTWPPNPP